ncbi:MAG TPA: carboxypeptidase-like regulatory domain-containing protein [Candidatus Edwardsbacteria bacterium]|nr:carboxypeptidase-like regulatory domain-containing protein [Candidatus Edwardsbacteria bacterium]
MKGTITAVLSLLTTLVLAAVAGGARYPLLGGPGLVHVQSAKTGLGFSYRTFNAASSYGDVNYYGMTGKQDALTDVWSYHSVGYAPNASLAVMVTGMAHGESWTVKNGAPLTVNNDKTLGCPGDAFVSGKYHVSLNEMFDLALEPMMTVPMDYKKYEDGPSQTGKLDVGGKVLCDVNLGAGTVYLNAGFLTRGDERAMVPLGAGFEYGFNEQLSAFAEASGELRVGSQKDAYPDSLVPKGRGFDRTEFRVTPGLRFAPLPYGAVNLAVDVGLTSSAAPWQVIFGIDIPASAGRFLTVTLPGIIAGMIRDARTGGPVKCMISFPGAGLPAIVSDASGRFNASVPPGEYKIEVMANGYRMQQRKMVVASRQTDTWDVKLNRKEGQLSITVTDAATGKPLAADIRFKDSALPDAKADPATGQYRTALVPGKYSLAIAAPGYVPQDLAFSIKDKEEKAQIVALQTPAAKKPEVIVPAATPAPGVNKGTPVKREPGSAGPRVVIKPVAPAVKLSPEELAGLYKTGVQLYMDEEYAKAIATFSTIVAADPGNTKARDYLKKAKERQKKIGG